MALNIGAAGSPLLRKKVLPAPHQKRSAPAVVFLQSALDK